VVEFCFVVRDNLIHKFMISGGKKITGRGSLSQYKVAGHEKKWGQNREEQDAVICPWRTSSNVKMQGA
jgi:hypothetical protein